jgi:hypothetical protein
VELELPAIADELLLELLAPLDCEPPVALDPPWLLPPVAVLDEVALPAWPPDDAVVVGVSLEHASPRSDAVRRVKTLRAMVIRFLWFALYIPGWV